jgi:hypothetical protein
MDIAPLNQKTGYVRWIKSQGLPIHTGHGMADLRALEVSPYARMGGKAAFIQSPRIQPAETLTFDSTVVGLGTAPRPLAVECSNP